MSDNNCSCRYNCTGLAIVASIIIGIVTAVLQITAVITVAPLFLWVVLGIAVVYLAVVLLAVASVNSVSVKRCFCYNIPVILTAILGAGLTAIILLAITFAATSIIGAIITGALLFFLSLIFTTIACLIKCIATCND